MPFYTDSFHPAFYYVGGYFGRATTSAPIREAVVAALKGDPGVAGVVGARVFPLVVPQRQPLPAVTVQLVSLTRPNRTLASPSALARAVVQVTAHSKLLADDQAAAEAVRQLLDGFAGVVATASGGSVEVLETVLQGERDLAADAADGSDRPVFSTALDYAIRYREPRPRGR